MPQWQPRNLSRLTKVILLQSLALVIRVAKSLALAVRVAKSSKESGSKLSRTTSSLSSKRAKTVAREADLAKLKVEQLKEKAQ